MPASDAIHGAVKNALVKDGWTITHDPYTVRFGGVRVHADLAAEKVIAGVITGVGFLGAGLIFRERDVEGGQPLGLTTAASSWAAAAVGILAGAGMYLTAIAACAIVLVILELNRLPLYRRIDPSKVRRDEAASGHERRPGRPARPVREDERPDDER